ncbi:uncharacterized protein ACA1_323390 [Acanthamoeba castellanii str. Neff]|uniref:Uncharacterized protein n=1 Tax=Acanthamoeba castellanii (strain ATCC 30010 / Neff) TaxID=1257118 RepID=L8H1K1_ACACF|nr:uncharacterized protein ACA1_323390 [Acanthamoeba castellanii str. Neff]ELR19105.1 hypothetical protein ACA1_323390 [Acanthamoeba castellanii str. Neff]
MEQTGEGTGVAEVSRTEAGMRVLLMQLAEAAALERSAERGRELLATVVHALRTILIALRKEECSDEGAEGLLKSRRAPFLRLDSFLEYVGYEDTADGLVLSDPDAAADGIESGLKALEWFEQQTQGKSDQALLTASQSGHKQSSKPSAMTDILDARIGDLLISQHEGAPEEGNRVAVVQGRAWWLGGGTRH